MTPFELQGQAMPAGLDTSVKSNDGLLSQSKPVHCNRRKAKSQLTCLLLLHLLLPTFHSSLPFRCLQPHDRSLTLCFSDCIGVTLFFEHFFRILPNQIYLPCVLFLHVLNRIQISQKTQNFLYLFFHLIYWPSLGWEDTLEEEIATHSSILAWRIPMDRISWGLPSMGSQ